MATKHRKVSGLPPVGPPASILTTDWDDTHVYEGGADGQVLTRDAGHPDGADWADPPGGDPAPDEVFVGPDEPTDPDTELWVDSDEDAGGGSGGGGGASLIGQGQLVFTSATLLTLTRKDGSSVPVKVDGTWQAGTIPAAGATLTNVGLAASTRYYIYAAGATVALEASTTAYAVDADSGVRIKTGDATRTLVGMVETNASAQFVSSATERLVRSWFHRDGALAENRFTANRATNSGTYVELHTEIRLKVLLWADEDLRAECSGVANGTSVATGYTRMGYLPTPTYVNGGTASTSASNGHINVSHAGVVVQPGEAVYTLTLYGRTDGGTTVTWLGGAATAEAVVRLRAWAAGAVGVSGGGGGYAPGYTPLDQSAWAWVNQGGASVVQAGGVVYLLTPGAAGTNVRGRFVNAPATPYTITAALLGGLPGGTHAFTGLCFREISTGKLFDIHLYNAGGATIEQIRMVKWTNATTVSAVFGTARSIVGHKGPVWLRITDDGTNLVFSYSPDGLNWMQMGTEARGTFMSGGSGPTSVGIDISCEDTATPGGAAGSFLSWVQS